RLTLRRSDQPPGLTSGQMEQSGQVIAKLWTDDLQKLARNGRYRFEDVVAFPDRNLIFQRSFYYALRFYSPRKVASSFSNMVFVSPLAPAEAPRIVGLRVSERAVELQWEAPRRNIDGSVPPRVIGYRLFRGGSEKTLEKLADMEG